MIYACFFILGIKNREQKHGGFSYNSGSVIAATDVLAKTNIHNMLKPAGSRFIAIYNMYVYMSTEWRTEFQQMPWMQCWNRDQ